MNGLHGVNSGLIAPPRRPSSLNAIRIERVPRRVTRVYRGCWLPIPAQEGTSPWIPVRGVTVCTERVYMRKRESYIRAHLILTELLTMEKVRLIRIRPWLNIT